MCARRERERVGLFGMRSGLSNEDMSFVGNGKASKLWYSSDSVFKTHVFSGVRVSQHKTVYITKSLYQ